MTKPDLLTEVQEELAEIDVDAPRVGIVMGSKSDMAAMEAASKELDERGIRNEVRVMSAHRDPDTVAEYAKNAKLRGLRGAVLEWDARSAVTVVLASKGYPESSSKGDVISGFDLVADEEVEVLHAGTAERDGEIVTAGGRVLNVTALGETTRAAREHAYAAADVIRFEGRQLRRDIAA